MLDPGENSGRKPTRRPVVHDVRRERSTGNTPALVTLRVLQGIPSLRKRHVIDALRSTFRDACSREGFGLVEYSIQRDHLHLIVEANGHAAMGNGMKSLAARVARAVNRCFSRAGKVLAGRYHVRWLRSPRQVWNALRYTLLNVRKHFSQERGAPPPVRIDEASSGCWFDGWTRRPTGRTPAGPKATANAASWLLRVGWRQHGLIDPAAVPGR